MALANEKPEYELRRLYTEQAQTRRDEVFGGMWRAERAEYNVKALRIRRLEGEIQASAGAKKSSQTATVTQRSQWKEESETDTPQAVARQPYRSREKDSLDPYSDSTRSEERV